jgi:nicotinamidase-related amidase
MATKPSEPPILLLIDLQQGLVEGPPEFGPRSTPNLVENVKYLLQTWRSKSWPILHVNHDDIADDTNIINSKYPEAFAFHSSSKPQDGEQVFTKHVGSPFVATEVPAVIKSYGNRKIVVIGMDGGQCVNSTVRHGSDLGFEMVVVADSCSSYGTEDWMNEGETLGAEETHKFAMGLLAGYATVTSTKNLWKALGYE